MTKLFSSILLFSMLSLLVLPLDAQSMHEKRIYLVDVTKSMVGKGSVPTPNIFSKVKQSLIEAISEIEDPQTEIVVVPFTNVTHKTITGYISQKDSLVSELSKLNVKNGDTNIADAWTFGESLLDSSKVNYMFLVTDGLHNCGPDKEVLYERLEEWDSIREGRCYFSFYVMLTQNAVENEIRNIAEQTQQMWSIQSLNIKAALIRTSLIQRSNIYNNKTVSVNFVSNNSKVFVDDLNVQFSIPDNPYYCISKTRKDSNHVGQYVFDIIEKVDRMKIPTDLMLTLHVNYNNSKYPLVFFTPENIEYRIINRGVRSMSIKVLRQ